MAKKPNTSATMKVMDLLMNIVYDLLQNRQQDMLQYMQQDTLQDMLSVHAIGKSYRRICALTLFFQLLRLPVQSLMFLLLSLVLLSLLLLLLLELLLLLLL